MKGDIQKAYGKQNRHRYTAEFKMKIHMEEHLKGKHVEGV
jgi:hypothetical protein